MKHDHAGANVITLVDDFEFLDEKNFEVAVTTLGDCKVKSDSEIIMTDKSRAVIVTITSSAEIELVAESVKDEGLGFTRLAIRLKGKHRKGWVKQEYHALN